MNNFSFTDMKLNYCNECADEFQQVTASGDQTVRLWDVNRDDCLAVFKGHTCSVKSVDFREDDICKLMLL